MSSYLDNDAKPCTNVDAHFVLVNVEYDVVAKPTEGEPMVLVPLFVSYVSECVTGLQVYSDGLKLSYALLECVSRYTPKIMSICGANIAGNYRCGLSQENHRDFYAVEYTPEPQWSEVMNDKKIYSILDGMPVSQVTADHHLFVNKREIMRVIRELRGIKCVENYERLVSMSIMLAQAEDKDINNRVSMITHLMYVAVAPLFAVQHLMKIWSGSDSPAEYMKLLKLESQAAKQLQTIFRDDLATVFELQVLRNRVFADVDWEAEIDHRVNVSAMPISSVEVYNTAMRIFRDAKLEGAEAHRHEWRTYWAGRWSSMPGGSVVSQYDTDRKLKQALPREGRIKAAWFSANRRNDYSYWHERKPQIYASTSTKYEWGKVRALYGCDVTSFLHSDFAMSNCENMLPSYFPVGRRANSGYINKVISSFSKGVPFCFDYDDFNSQHSTASMSAVLRAWRDTFKSNLSAEQLRSMQWTIESVEDMVVQFNEAGKTIHINGTLMSGWRLTSFINSVLNRVYLEKAGLKKNVIYALHNGDDMFATTQNLQQAMNVVKNAQMIGIRAQVAKTNLGTIGEFLRVDTRATNKSGAQYLARSVATAVHGRVETGAPNDLLALHSANNERMHAIIERGGSERIVKAVSSELTNFECRLFDVDASVLTAYDTLHPTQGGCNEEGSVKQIRLERIPDETTEAFRQRLGLINPGIDDYIQLVVDKFRLPQSKVSRTDVRNKAYDSLSRNKVRYRIVTETDQRALVYRGLYKAWAKSTYIAPVSKLRSVGMANARYLTNVRGPVVSMIANSHDPAKMMATVF